MPEPQLPRTSSEDLDAYFDPVYTELRRLAQRYLRAERPDHTLQATALVHEVYLRLAAQTRARFKNRAQFFAVAATAMRRILVDHARARGSDKRPGAHCRLSLDEALTISRDCANTDLIALDLALDRLKQIEPDKVRLVELRFFAGLTVAETAEALGVNERTVYRHWDYAKAWLYREMTSGASPP